MILALQTESGGHLGFVLFSEKNSTSGDCIVRPLATNAQLMDTLEYRYLSQLRGQEFIYHFESGHDRIIVEVPDKQLCFERETPSQRHQERNSGLKLFGELVIK